MTKLGRPIIPDSERQCEPWKAFGMSRATFYWKKRYGDLPQDAHAHKAWLDSRLQNTLKRGSQRQGGLKRGVRESWRSWIQNEVI